MLGLVLYQLPLAHDIAAVAPTCHRSATPRSSREVAAVLREVVTLAGHIDVVKAWRWHPTAASSPARTIAPFKLWRDGACERTIQAHDRRHRARGGAAGRNALRQRLGRPHREAVDARRRARAHVRGGHRRRLRRAALPDGVHFVVGAGHGIRTNFRSGCTTSTGRSSTPSRGTPGSVLAVAVTNDGQHIISGSSDTDRQGVERRHQEPREHLRRAHRARCRSGGDARRPAHPQRRATIPLACGCSTAPTRTPSSCTLASWTPSWRCPTTSTRSPARATRRSSSSTSTTAPSCAPSRTTLTAFSLALLPDGRRFVSGSADNTACIVEHGLAPERAEKLCALPDISRSDAAISFAVVAVGAADGSQLSRTCPPPRRRARPRRSSTRTSSPPRPRTSTRPATSRRRRSASRRPPSSTCARRWAPPTPTRCRTCGCSRSRTRSARTSCAAGCSCTTRRWRRASRSSSAAPRAARSPPPPPTRRPRRSPPRRASAPTPRSRGSARS